MSGHEMRYAAKWKVGTRFFEQGIWLYIDDGDYGGGEQIKHKDTLSELDFIDLYDSNYNGNNGFTQSRESKFHYCVFADGIWTGRTGRCHGDRFVVADGHILIGGVTAQAGTFMHELGHSIGLLQGDESEGAGYFPGIDRYYDLDYKSCMNYYYTTSLVDYSDGSNGADDHEDWGDIRITMDRYI